MFGDFGDVVERKLAVSRAGLAADRVMPLGDAVERFVRPGMHLHLGHSYARPCAAAHEIARRFAGKDPQFTISTLGFTGDLACLFAAGTIRKAIATFYGDSYPMPGPNPVYQKCYREGTVLMENWTILSFSLRLLAGALGMEWIPAMSLLGTAMEEENKNDYFVAETPGAGRMGFARALRPDVAFLHGWAADPAGNVVCAPPYAEGPTSARGAKEGVIVTVERVVDAEFIRRYSHFVKVPSYLVRAVCPAPLGSHPAGMSNYGLESEFTGYEVDREFLIDFREQAKDERKLETWMERWITGCVDHEEYLARLGHERIWFLMGKSSPDSWRWELADAIPEMNDGPGFNPVEMMVVAGARLIARKAREGGYRTILAGVGASNLAAWLAYYDLMESGHDVDLMAEVGFFGYSPRPADPYIFNLRNVPQCRMLTDINDVLGSLVGAESNRCIGALGAGQVDRYGTVNSTQVPELKLYLVGSGGAADVAAGAQEIVILMNHSKFRLVEEVPYVTCPGTKVTAVVTTRGILEKRDGELVLTGYFAGEDGEEDVAVASLREECGWDLKVADDLARIEPPTLDELKSARVFDPHSFFLGKGD